MSRSFGFIALLLVTGIVGYLYMKNTVAVSPSEDGKAGPRATIDIVGVKNDLNAIAQGERRYWASNSKYVSIDDLRADGDISLAANGRGAYQYSADYSENAFRITATYQGPPLAGVPHSFNIDQNMEIREGP
jgi:hypothetical protein